MPVKFYQKAATSVCKLSGCFWLRQGRVAVRYRLLGPPEETSSASISPKGGSRPPPRTPRAKSRPDRARVLLWAQPPQLYSALLHMHGTTNHRAFAVPLVTHHRVAHCGGTGGISATSVVAEKGTFTLFLLLDFACTSECGRSTASHPCLPCYLVSGVLSSRPPRGIPPP